jgi:formylglycine-generating enzyme required for sulfatase activity
MLDRIGRLAVAGVVAAGLLAGMAQAAFVTVGNPGNANDTHGAGYGAVAYEYQISQFEVTAGEYTAFLNAVAATDSYGLYNTSMWTDTYPCKIQRSGSSGSYTYSVAADYADRPVNFVSWYDAARYTNWLTTGNTESGVYNTSTWAALPHDTAPATLGVATAYFIPTENEWYKAAYYDPALNGGAGGYYDYPTGSDSQPGRSMGETTNPGNNANYYTSSFTLGSPYYRTIVGEFELSTSPFGTFDQGGNVYEWNETLSGSWRVLRGGSFNSAGRFLRADERSNFNPSSEDSNFGFRVASSSVIPEPGSLVLLALAGLATVARRPRVV